MTEYVRHCTECGFVASVESPPAGNNQCPVCPRTGPYELGTALKVHYADRGPLLTPAEAKAQLAVLTHYFNEPVLPMSRYCGAFEAWLTAIQVLNAREPRDEHDKKEHRVGHAWAQFISDIKLSISKSSMLGRLLYGGEKHRTRECPEHKGKWSGMEHPENPCPHGCNFVGWLPEDDDPVDMARKAYAAEVQTYPILTEPDALARSVALGMLGDLSPEAFKRAGLKLTDGLRMGKRVRYVSFRSNDAPWGFMKVRERTGKQEPVFVSVDEG